MAEEPKNMYQYRVLRYVPNALRDEWINIGVLLEELDDRDGGAASRRAIRLVEEQSEIARVKRLHPGADEGLLRALPAEFDARLRTTPIEAATNIEKLDQTLSNFLQFSPQKGLLADDFEA